jgi:hypothetical protein
MTSAEFRKVIENLHLVLIDLQKDRDKRPGIVEGQLEWVIYERNGMLAAVNNLRETYGKEPVSIDDVCRVESDASGNCDYTRKFGLYCAELVAKD